MGNYMELKRVNDLEKINNSRIKIDLLIIKDRSLGVDTIKNLSRRGKKKLRRIFSQESIFARE